MLNISRKDIKSDTFDNKKNALRSKITPGNNHNVFFTWELIPSKSSIISFSSGIEAVTGYSGKEINNLAKGIESLIVDDDCAKLKKEYNTFLKDPSTNRLIRDYGITCKDGSSKWIWEEIIADRTKTGKVKSLSGFAFDITPLKEAAELQTEKFKALKELNENKDKFISMLSHDLRSPFTSILGFVEILINEPNLSLPERSEYLQYIHESSQHQLQFINYLLDWSRLQTGRVKVETEKLNLSTIIFNCISSLTGNAIRKGIEIKVNLSEKINVLADERLLGQIVTNLLSNAIKFSNEDSKVEITADFFNEDFVEVVISDVGIGIPEINKEKLFKFEMMFSTEGTKGEKGTGLGLSLAKEIVEKHNGTIWFYSEEKKGSEFHFTIPLSKNNILLIMPNETERAKLGLFVKDLYPMYNLTEAANGFEAIEKFYKDIPSLILLQHNMPLMNGLQLIESIKSDTKNFNVPFIAVVDNISREIQDSYFKLEAKAVLPKPVDFNLLSRHIEISLS